MLINSLEFHIPSKLSKTGLEMLNFNGEELDKMEMEHYFLNGSQQD